MRPAFRPALTALAGAGLVAAPLPAALAETADADADAVAGFESAGSLLRKCKEASSYSRNYCFAYLAAVADAARSYRIWIGAGDPCLPAGLSLGRLADTYEEYLIANPSLTRAQAASVVVASLQDAFPCPAPVRVTIPQPAPSPLPPDPTAPRKPAAAPGPKRSQ